MSGFFRFCFDFDVHKVIDSITPIFFFTRSPLRLRFFLLFFTLRRPIPLFVLLFFTSFLLINFHYHCQSIHRLPCLLNHYFCFLLFWTFTKCKQILEYAFWYHCQIHNQLYRCKTCHLNSKCFSGPQVYGICKNSHKITCNPHAVLIEKNHIVYLWFHMQQIY